MTSKKELFCVRCTEHKMMCGQSAERAIRVDPGSGLTVCPGWTRCQLGFVTLTIMFDLNHRFQLFYCSASQGFLL